MGAEVSNLKRGKSSRRTRTQSDTSRQKPRILETKTTAITDDYTLLTKREIGTGISGKVILCQHKATKVKYALKKIKDSRSARREIALQWKAQQNFFHIVQIVDVYENKIRNDAFFFIIMEYCEGGELFNKIRNRKTPFTELEVAKIMSQIVDTVAHLHTMGIAHRDLKPENLLLYTRSDKNLQIKLCDFGFAKEASQGLMTPNYTPYYVAPEILRFEKYDISCDIWSLGVIMYILCCGYPPFYSLNGNKTSPGMESRIKNGIFSFANKEWSCISNSAKDLIRDMLETVPEKRVSIDDIKNSDWIANYNLAPKTEINCVKNIKKDGVLDEALTNFGQALNEMRVDWEAKVLIKEPDPMKNAMLKRRLEKKAGSKTCDNINKILASKTPPKCSPKVTPKGSPATLIKSKSVPATLTALYYSSNLKNGGD